MGNFYRDLAIFSGHTADDYPILQKDRYFTRQSFYFYYFKNNPAYCSMRKLSVKKVTPIYLKTNYTECNETKKMPNVFKSCPKMILLENWKFLLTYQKLPRNMSNLGKLIVATALKTCPKCNKSPNLVTLMECSINRADLLLAVWVAQTCPWRECCGSVVQKPVALLHWRYPKCWLVTMRL